MSIRTKLILLLALLMGLLLIGFLYIMQVNTYQLKVLQEKEIQDKNRLFDQIVELKGASLSTHAYDYTFWDEMVAFVNTADRMWADENIGTSLSTYKTDAAWVLKPDFSPVYAANIFDDPSFKPLPLPRSSFTTLFAKGYFTHFFVSTPRGIVEMRSAPIQPTSDVERVTNPHGFFFVGRVWDQKYIEELGRLTQSTVRLLPMPSILQTISQSSGRIALLRVLRGWDDEPVAQMQVESSIPLVAETSHFLTYQFALLIAVFAVGLLGFTLFFGRWVNSPLSSLSKALAINDLHGIDALSHQKSEFGRIAALLQQIFTHENKLEEELAIRKRAEEQMRVTTQDLHQLNQAMVGRELKMIELKKEIEELKKQLAERR